MESRGPEAKYKGGRYGWGTKCGEGLGQRAEGRELSAESRGRRAGGGRQRIEGRMQNVTECGGRRRWRRVES